MKNYPNQYHEMRRLIGELQLEIPETMKGFGAMHKSACGDGVLPSKTKELIALAISITSRCDGCISYHIHDALKTGATKKEIVETIGVAILMGGGPSLMYGCEALDALKQFSLEQETSVSN